MPRALPVWGFPQGYNPNERGDRCELCGRTDSWLPRPVPGQSFVAWTCICCAPASQLIPID